MESIQTPDHGLGGLWEIVEDSIIPKVWPEILPERFEAVDNCIREFQKQDPNSIAFRYPDERRTPSDGAKPPVRRLIQLA